MSQSLAQFAAQLRAFIASPATREDAVFNRLALDLFALQFACNAPYRRLCEARHVAPGGVSHWSGIPAMPTRAFKDFELTCLPPAERSRVFHSSGTTGQTPSRHFHSAVSLELYEASLQPWFRRHLRADGFGGRLLSLTPPAHQAPYSSLVHMLATLARVGPPGRASFLSRVAPDGAWELDVARAAAEVEQACAEPQPLLLAGTAFSFVHLLDHLAGAGRRFALPTGSRVMETGGYKGRSRVLPKEALHRLLTDRLGVPPDFIVCEYGMSELNSQAYDQIAGFPRNTPNETRPFHFPPWARAVVVSPETARAVAEGETGLLRVCDLANGFSVLAVQTEDLAVRRGEGFELIGRAERAEPRGCSLLPAVEADRFPT